MVSFSFEKGLDPVPGSIRQISEMCQQNKPLQAHVSETRCRQLMTCAFWSIQLANKQPQQKTMYWTLKGVVVRFHIVGYDDIFYKFILLSKVSIHFPLESFSCCYHHFARAVSRTDIRLKDCKTFCLTTTKPALVECSRPGLLCSQNTFIGVQWPHSHMFITVWSPQKWSPNTKLLSPNDDSSRSGRQSMHFKNYR